MADEKIQKEEAQQSEEKTTQEQPKNLDESEENSPENTNDEGGPLQQAQDLKNSIDKATEKFESLVKRNEKILADLSMMGSAKAGSIARSPEQETKEKVDEEVKKALEQYK